MASGERIEFQGLFKYQNVSLQGLPLKGAVFDSSTFIKKWIEIKEPLHSTSFQSAETVDFNLFLKNEHLQG